MNDWLKFEKKGSIATLTMNRPDIRNPLGEPEDVINFEEASDLINNDRDIRCVILTGAGKAFSAGGNVKNMQNKSGNFSGSSVALRERYRFGIHKIIKAIWNIDVPVIAAINGPAIGLGNDVACLADMRISSEKALFGVTFLKIGLIPGEGTTEFDIQLSDKDNNEPRINLLLLRDLNKTESSNFFTQISLHTQDIGVSDNRYIGNFGLGFRRLSNDNSFMFGANLFYDHDLQEDHSRASIGLEAKAGILDFHFNHYEAASLQKVLGYTATPLVRYFVLETPMDNLITPAINDRRIAKEIKASRSEEGGTMALITA